MSLPRFPSFMFPQSVAVTVCDDVTGRQGGANPVPGSPVTLAASVQDKGTYFDAARMASVSRYRVSFAADPTPSLTRALRAGDRITWGAVVLTTLAPATDRGGYSFLWRVDCEHVHT